MSKILGVRIDEYDFNEVMKKITKFLSTNKFHQIATVNPEFIVAAQKDKEFKKILNSTDLNIPDGFGLKIAGILKQQKIGERITGVDLTWEICKLASEKCYTVFFLGGARGVAEKAAKIIKMVHKDLIIAGTYAGNPEEKGIFERILKTKPDILLVAFGAPKQDKFIHNLKLKIKNLKFPHLAVGVGGTFDYISGSVARAPKWMRSLGLEWLFRLIKQPSRIHRIYTAVIKFPLMVVFKIK